MAHWNSDPDKAAQSLLGIPYQWGGRDPRQGLDCYGLVIEWMFRWSGIRIQEETDTIFRDFISLETPLPGAVVFLKFRDSKVVNHVVGVLTRDRVIHTDRLAGAHITRLHPFRPFVADYRIHRDRCPSHLLNATT